MRRWEGEKVRRWEHPLDYELCIMNYELKEMKIIYNKLIPMKGYKAVNLFGVLFAREGARLTAEDIRHEEIHTAQMRETLYVVFYIWYAAEWLARFIGNGLKAHLAYRNVVFEREAYCNQQDAGYMDKRKAWDFLKFYKKEYSYEGK